MADHLSSARRRIAAAIKKIPYGKVASYGQIARRADLPGRARLVARVLKESEGAVLPWHRVVRSDGAIAFAREHAHFALQVGKLQAEGVQARGGKVAATAFAWSNSLDAALWRPRDA